MQKDSETGDKKRGGINSQRADVISKVVTFMGEHIPTKGESEEALKKRIAKRFKYWLGRTRKISPGEIYRLMSTAKAEGKNPQALFNHLIKSYGKHETLPF